MGGAWRRIAIVFVFVCGGAAASAQMLDPSTGMMVDPFNDPADFASVVSGQPGNASSEALAQLDAQQKSAADLQAFLESSSAANQNSQGDDSAPAIPQTAAPAVMPPGGSFKGQIMVTILDRDPNATLHYTVDGSKPSGSSPEYAGAFTVDATTKVRAIAVKNGETPSSVVTKTFKIKS